MCCIYGVFLCQTIFEFLLGSSVHETYSTLLYVHFCEQKMTTHQMAIDTQTYYRANF